METLHAEGESPFVVNDDAASVAAILALGEKEGQVQYVDCPVEGCGEALLLTEIESHIEMHAAESQDSDEEADPCLKKAKPEEQVAATFDTKLSYALRNIPGFEDDEKTLPKSEFFRAQENAKAAWKSLLKMPDPKANSAVSNPPSKGSRRRLGVRFPFLTDQLPYYRRTNTYVEIRIRPPCEREADAVMACQIIGVGW